MLASNAAVRAEVVPGRGRADRREDGPCVAMQRELFSQEKSKEVRASRHPWAWLLKRVFAVEVLVCVHCAGKLRLVEIAGGGSGHQADHPRRTTPARAARGRDGGARTTARTAVSVDVRVSVRETE